MLDTLTNLGIGGILALVLFFLIRDVLGPLVKKKQQPGDRVTVLEINLTKLTTRVEDFGKVLAEQSEMVDKLGLAVDNKMDIVLAELKEIRGEFAEAYRTMTERISKAETHIEHLLERRGTN